MIVLLAIVAGCQEPFGADRHDLLGDRIVAVTAQADGDAIAPSAALLVGGHLFSDEAVALSWGWDADGIDFVEVATGPSPTLEVGGDTLALEATFPSGHVARAIYPLPTDLNAGPTPQTLGLPTSSLASDDEIELTATFTVDDADPRLRWMTVGGRGTFVETSRPSTRFILADVVFDDGEEESRTPVEDGPLTVMGLAVTDDGRTAWRVEDGFVGDVPTGGWLADGRFIGTDIAVAVGSYEGIVASEDDASLGITLTGVAADTGTAAALATEDLVTGDVLRADLVGSVVSVTFVEVTP